MYRDWKRPWSRTTDVMMRDGEMGVQEECAYTYSISSLQSRFMGIHYVVKRCDNICDVGVAEREKPYTQYSELLSHDWTEHLHWGSYVDHSF
jgi:hypothetical protein